MQNMEHRLLYFVLLLVSKACFSSQQTSAQNVTSDHRDTGNRTTFIANGNGNVTNNAPYTSQAVPKHCSLFPENENISEEIKKALENGMTMLRFKLKFRGEEKLPENVSSKATNNMFKPFYWVRTTGRFGTRLLLLKPNYGIMSFRSLEMKVEKFQNINLKEYPENCMDNLSIDDIEQIIRELVMNSFKNESDKLDETDNVCNLHITNDDGADFRYYCCQRDEKMSITCDYLETDIWLTLMRNVIRVIKAFVILFCPLLIPKSFFRKLSDSDCFRYKLDKSFKIMLQLEQVVSYRSIQKQRTDLNTDDEQNIYVKLSELKDMEKLKKRVQEMPLDETKTFDVKVAELQTDGKRLVNPGQAPSRVLQTLYEFLFNCRVREMPSVNSCCDANICRLTPCVITWHTCASIIMKIFFGLLIITPWIIRIAVYYQFEHSEITMRKEAARDKGYHLPYPGNFSWYLTPFHGLFIFIYAFLFIETLIYGVITNKIKEEFKFIFRKCNKDMLSDSRTKAFGRCMQLLLLPFTSLGCWVILVGVFMWAILIPVAILYMVYHLFPLVNLSVRMLVHLVVYVFLHDRVEASTDGSMSNDQTDGSTDSCLAQCKTRIKKEYTNMRSIMGEMSLIEDRLSKRPLSGRLIQFCVVLMCLITTYSCMGLLFEMTTFFLDVFIYTMIGCILYADDIMTYMSLLFLLVVYAKDCFGSVSEQYRQYSSTLNKYLMTLCEQQATPVFYENSKAQKNRAFAVVPCSTKDDPCEAAGRVWPDHTDVNVTYDSGHLTWNVKKVAFFLTENDGPMIPSKFLFEATRFMAYSNKPGRLLHLYLKALLNFTWIVAFLMFVFLVVMAFGESGQFSMSNKLLATIAGGILPLLLRKFVFAEIKQPEIDPQNDINFRVAVHDLINSYDQNWAMHDLDTFELIVHEKAFSNGRCENEPDVSKQPEGDNGTVILEPPTYMNGKTHHTVDVTNRDKVTKVIILFKTSDIDKEDFPMLYQRMEQSKKQTEGEDTPLTVKVETV